MISAIVLAGGGGDREPTRLRERAVRSLAWLVPAVVSGVVRDVVAACPSSWDVVDIMEHAGCDLVRDEDEGRRIAAAAALVKCERVLVVGIGFQPEGPLAAEIDAFESVGLADRTGLVLQAPTRLFERLLPDRAPVVGVLTGRERLRDPLSFSTLARSARAGPRLRTRMVPVL